MTGKKLMQDLQHKLAGQEWIESFRYPSIGKDASSPVCTILSHFGFKQIQTGAYNAIQQCFADLLSDWPSNIRLPKLKWQRPPHFDQYTLPQTHEFESLCFRLAEQERQIFLLAVESDWPVFRDHFPGQPILSGVLQLHWVTRYSHYFLQHQLIPTEIRQLKFRSIFEPPGWLFLELNAASDSQVGFQVLSNGTVHAQGRLCYAT